MSLNSGRLLSALMALGNFVEVSAGGLLMGLRSIMTSLAAAVVVFNHVHIAHGCRALLTIRAKMPLNVLILDSLSVCGALWIQTELIIIFMHTEIIAFRTTVKVTFHLIMASVF